MQESDSVELVGGNGVFHLGKVGLKKGGVRPQVLLVIQSHYPNAIRELHPFQEAGKHRQIGECPSGTFLDIPQRERVACASLQGDGNPGFRIQSGIHPHPHPIRKKHELPLPLQTIERDHRHLRRDLVKIESHPPSGIPLVIVDLKPAQSAGFVLNALDEFSGSQGFPLFLPATVLVWRLSV